MSQVVSIVQGQMCNNCPNRAYGSFKGYALCFSDLRTLEHFGYKVTWLVGRKKDQELIDYSVVWFRKRRRRL